MERLLRHALEYQAPLDVVAGILDALQMTTYLSNDPLKQREVCREISRSQISEEESCESGEDEEDEGSEIFSGISVVLRMSCSINDKPKEDGSSYTFGFLELVLQCFPELAHKPCCGEGMLPIHVVSSQPHQQEQMLRLLLEIHPEGAAQQDDKGQLPLHLACDFPCRPALIQELLTSYPAGARVCDSRGNLPLHRCVASVNCWYTEEHVQSIKMLLQAHADAAQVPFGEKERTLLPLHFACQQDRSLPVVKALMKAFPEGVITSDQLGRLPIHDAAQNGRVDVVKTLLHYFPASAQHAAEKDGKKLPIHCIFEGGGSRGSGILKSSHVSVAKELLLTYPQAAFTPRETDGRTPLHLACDRQDPNLVFSLLRACPLSAAVPDRNGELPLALHVLASQSYCNHVLPGEIKDRLLRAVVRANPEAATTLDSRGRTPLHWACENRDHHYSLHLVLFLTRECPKSARIRDCDGCLPLHLCRHHAIAQEVIRAYPDGASIADNDRRKWLPLHAACADTSGRNLGLVSLLLRVHPQGCLSPDAQGRLPLHICGHAAYADQLLRVEPDAAFSRDGHGQLPLHTACETATSSWSLTSSPLSSPSPVWPLLEANPSAVGKQDSAGRTPLHIVCSHKHASVVLVREMCCVFRRYRQSADKKKSSSQRITSVMETRDANHRTPLHVACAESSPAVIEELLRGGDAKIGAVAACLKQPDRFGMTPFHIACIYGASTDILYRLLRMYSETCSTKC